MAAGQPLKSNDTGLLLRNMGNRTTNAPKRTDPSDRKQLHIQRGKVVGLDLSRESSDARIRSITPKNN